MGIHGFASGLPFQVKELQEDRIVLELRDTEATFSSYPYHFSLQVSYALFENEIRIGYHVENFSENTMYFGIGGHPGFRVPLEDDLDFEDYFLEFHTACRPDRVGHTAACFLSGENTEFPLQNGKILPFYHGMFDDDAVVLQNMSDCVTLKRSERKPAGHSFLSGSPISWPFGMRQRRKHPIFVSNHGHLCLPGRISWRNSSARVT